VAVIDCIDRIYFLSSCALSVYLCLRSDTVILLKKHLISHIQYILYRQKDRQTDGRNPVA